MAAYPNPEVTSSDAGCLVAVDDARLFLAGGSPGSRRAFIYSREGDFWRELGSMRVGRKDHSCGLANRYREVFSRLLDHEQTHATWDSLFS